MEVSGQGMYYVCIAHLQCTHLLGSQPQRKFEEDNRVLKKQSKPTLKPIHFMNPASGPRLGVFEPSDSNVEEMPCGSLNLTEVNLHPSRSENTVGLRT